MRCSIHLLLLLSLSSFLLLPCTTAVCAPRHHSTTQGKVTADTLGGFQHSIHTMCTKTDNPDICISSIKPFLPDSGTIDATTMLKMEIKAVEQGIEKARAMATTLSGKPDTPSTVVQTLNICVNNYDDAIDEIRSTVKAMEGKDVGTMNSMLSAALTDFSTCEDAFAELPGLHSPLADQDDELAKLASNCLAIAAALN